MSYRIVFGLCFLVMGCDASGGAREAEKSVEEGMATNLMKPIPKKPNPTDPACGACRYSVNEQLVYASLEGVADMPPMDLVLYSSSKQVLQRHFGLEPRTYAPGRATYPVPDGAMQDVGYGVLSWEGRTGYYTKTIPVGYESVYIPQ